MHHVTRSDARALGGRREISPVPRHDREHRKPKSPMSYGAVEVSEMTSFGSRGKGVCCVRFHHKSSKKA
jgi:hypothetical protein